MESYNKNSHEIKQLWVLHFKTIGNRRQHNPTIQAL